MDINHCTECGSSQCHKTMWAGKIQCLSDPLPTIEHIFNKPGAAILPSFCSVAVLKIQEDPPWLSAEERAMVEKAVPSRQREFAAGRAAARCALQAIGITPTLIRIRSDRSPDWPAGIVGSISHCSDYAGAAVAPNSVSRSIGLDLELREAVRPELWDAILTAGELQQLHKYPSALRCSLASLLFSAKESFFKFQFPLTRTWLEFKEVEIYAINETGSFRVRSLRPVGNRQALKAAGRLNASIRHVATAIWAGRSNAEPDF